MAMEEITRLEQELENLVPKENEEITLEKLARIHIASYRSIDRKIKELEGKVKPISDIYVSFRGFGSIALGFIKWIVVPLSVVIGVILSLKKLFHMDV